MPAFRGDQVLRWVYQRGVADPLAMTDIAKADQQELRRRLGFTAGRVVRHDQASDGVQKLLLQWPAPPRPTSGTGAALGLPLVNDDPAHQTECVLIPSARSGSGRGSARQTACISSQIGCPVGCTFCASGLGGLDGDLVAGQIVEQVWRLSTLPMVERITHVVFMGMGEPLANFEQVVQAVRALTAPWGLGISPRRVTISTVGLPAQIRRLAKLDLPITLAISLHAPNDALRQELIPWAKHIRIEQLIDAARFYFAQTHREVTLEYTLMRGVNDQPDHATQLARVAKQIRSNVNLIRYNPVSGLAFERPATPDVHRFQSRLRGAGVNTHIRASRGRDIAAACGQLRHEQRLTAATGTI